MSIKTPAERAKRYRYATQLNKNLERLGELLEEMPDDFDKTKLDITLDYYLFQMLGKLLRVDEPQFYLLDSSIDIRYSIPVNPNFADKVRNSTEADSLGRQAYEAWSRNEMQERSYERKMSKAVFCKEHFNANFANPRWGWVGVREQEGEIPGALFLFAWEHAFDALKPSAVRLFHSDLNHHAGSRRHPGHRDALEKIQQATLGNLTPYIVWQEAEDPDAEPYISKGINVETISRCELAIDTDGYWTATIGEPIWLPFDEQPRRVEG